MKKGVGAPKIVTSWRSVVRLFRRVSLLLVSLLTSAVRLGQMGQTELEFRALFLAADPLESIFWRTSIRQIYGFKRVRGKILITNRLGMIFGNLPGLFVRKILISKNDFRKIFQTKELRRETSQKRLRAAMCPCTDFWAHFTTRMLAPKYGAEACLFSVTLITPR